MSERWEMSKQSENKRGKGVKTIKSNERESVCERKSEWDAFDTRARLAFRTVCGCVFML